MPLFNRNNAYDPHNNTILHERAQQIINGEHDNLPYDPNNRVNNRCNNVIGTTTNIRISRNGSTNSPASYNTDRSNANTELNIDNTSETTNNNNKINKNSDSTNADANPTTNDNTLTNNNDSNENNLDNVNTSYFIFRTFANSNGAISGKAE